RDSESIFDGSARMAAGQPMGAAARLTSDAPVRHLSGYSEFVAFAGERGESSAVLASDPARLIAFAQASAADFAKSSSLRNAAEVFLGNVIAGLRPEARWRLWDAGPNLVGNQRIQFDPESIVTRLMKGEP